MEAHYREVASLDARETERRIFEAGADDPGSLAYKKVLKDGEDPRRKIAQQIVDLISNIRSIITRPDEALEAIYQVATIERLNAQANMLLIDPHLRRGLKILQSAKEGNEEKYGTSEQKQERKRKIVETYKRLRSENPSLKQEALYREISGRLGPGHGRSTILRALRPHPRAKPD
jgi:hypothetical protein